MSNVTPFRRPPKRPPAPQQSGGLGFKTHRGKAVLVQLLTAAAFVVNYFFPYAPLSFVGLGVGSRHGAERDGYRRRPVVVVHAFSNRYEAMPWARTHHEHALRTLLIGYSILVALGLVPLLFGGGYTQGETVAGLRAQYDLAAFWLRIAVIIWAVLRAGVGLVLALMRKPITKPAGILF